MKLDEFMVGIVIFSVIIFAGVLIIADINTTYPTANMDTSEWNETYNQIDEMYELSGAQKNKTFGAELTDTEAWETSVKGSYSTIRLIRGTFRMTGAIMNNLAHDLGIPRPFVVAGTVVMLIMIFMSVVYLVFRFKP